MDNPNAIDQEDTLKESRNFAEKNLNRSSVFGDTTKTPLEQITGTPEVISLKELKSSDIIFAVIGPTGSGKSTFIKAITGYACEVGHGIDSCTQDIQVIRMVPISAMDPSICFIDTPGFDDAERSDYSTFETLSQTLISICKQGLLLSGLLYFHRISDVRMGGTPLTNIRFFHQLCSTELSRLVYVTTMWDLEDPEVAVKRETDLVATYWRPLVNTGCTTKRYLNNRESGVKIIWPLLQKEMERRGGLDTTVKTKSSYIAHGGEILATLLVDRWQQLKNAGRFRRQIRKLLGQVAPVKLI
ncbi:P-loop containing nucleoside triphosphate hydrolase protein [Crepidotus variabilis]|uniref:P-loop containing nucleoside triphosphate hydrolase protein n=1 Tax=Crepidotus variabilis TaxID=179855 RepID=A0A9P6JV86_9AGAR|nr:P-loop containing nucleoside triphosphate hydrolase protein [Crepidotus variabilis]